MKRIWGYVGTAIFAGVAASACCLGPALLVTLGIGGAWVGQLTRLAPFRPFFLGGAWILLGLSFLQHRRIQKDCKEGVCEVPRAAKIRLVSLWVGAVILLISTFGPIGLQIFATWR